MTEKRAKELQAELEDLYRNLLKKTLVTVTYDPAMEFFGGMDAGKMALARHVLEKYFGVTVE